MTPSSMRRSLLAVGVLAMSASFLALRPAPAQHAPADEATFMAQGREGTRRYLSQQQAIDDGFRRVGGEFPAMGEHWVSFERVMDDTLDARRPSVLIYINSADGPRLAGVAYSRLLKPGQSPPAFPFDGAWHEHNGAVDEESLPRGHGAHHGDAMTGAPADPTSPRFYILHAWAWTPNPDGAFVTDNWRLPLARLGIADTLAVDGDAARALALAADEDDYHRTMIAGSLSLSAGDDSTVARVIQRRRAEASAAAASVRATHELSPANSARLVAAWRGMWNDLTAALPARAGELRDLGRRM